MLNLGWDQKKNAAWGLFIYFKEKAFFKYNDYDVSVKEILKCSREGAIHMLQALLFVAREEDRLGGADHVLGINV